MEIDKVLEELHAERNHLDQVIRSLESMREKPDLKIGESSSPKRRGRKSMSQKERLAVSKRMRQYWEKRRQK
jgi:isoaspartyl peptidase/L-asparaginase-like protein (Ntn-hydrolase superfamily)